MDGKGRQRCWSWKTPKMRPCRVVLYRALSKSPLWKCPPQRHLTPQPPHHRKGFMLSLSASVLVTTAKRQPFAHAEKMYKEDRGASHQRGGEKPTQPQREPAASPGEKPGARRRQAEAAALGRSTWPGAGRSAAEPQRRRSRWRCWKRSEPSRPDPLARLLAPTLPDSSLTPERPASP